MEFKPTQTAHLVGKERDQTEQFKTKDTHTHKGTTGPRWGKVIIVRTVSILTTPTTTQSAYIQA